MPRFLGLVNLHDSPQLRGITETRPLASASFLGRFAFVDFPLSNFSNSKIDTIGILVKEKPRSLIKHIGSGKMWNANTKIGSLSLMYNEKGGADSLYNHDINNIIENRWVIDQADADYVLIAPCHLIYRLDFSKVIHQHIKNKSKITMVYKTIKPSEKNDFIDCDCLILDHHKHVKMIQKNFGNVTNTHISLETYVISRDFLEELFNRAQRASGFFSLRDILSYACSEIEIDTYEYEGYLRNFNSLEHYFKYSLEFLKKDNLALLDEDWPIFTRTYDSPPVHYTASAKVRDSYIANGSIIEGKVTSSIISRSCKIEKGAHVRNCIVFSEATIKSGTIIENCVIDKKATIENVRKLEGDAKIPLYIKEGDKI